MSSSYSQLIDKLFAINLTGGIKLGLNNALSLNEILGFPAQAYPTIHVAGTNGKGSVVTKIAKAFELTGLKVGMYTSPHIASFRERMCINGQMISEKAVESIVTDLFTIIEREKIPATFFELTTLMAFKYFADQDVDVAVIETGLGGRLDATNIVHPKLCVITSIGFDHTELLGDTVEAIAYEKAGIIKPNTPVVLGPSVPLQVIQPIAENLQSEVYPVTGIFETYDQENSAVAAAALKLLHVPQEAIEEGIKVRPRCRFELFSHDKLKAIFKEAKQPEALILDVAHNPDGFRRLVQELYSKFPQKALFFVCGLSKNKDVSACLTLLKESGKRFYLVNTQHERVAPAALLKEQLLSLGAKSSDIFTAGSVKTSLQLALHDAAEHNAIVVVCGTFFIMEDVYAALE